MPPTEPRQISGVSNHFSWVVAGLVPVIQEFFLGSNPQEKLTHDLCDDATRATIGLRLPMALLLFAALLTGCTDRYYEEPGAVALTAGDAPAANIAVHTIDPWPPGSSDRRVAANGQRIQGAIDRYRNNKVAEPQGAGTSSVKYAPILAAPSGSAATN